MLRKYNIESNHLAPETLALCEMLRGHIDDTVVRAQRNLYRQRAASDKVIDGVMPAGELPDCQGR